MAEHVRITDVSPRDGLQNEPGVIPTAEKVRLIELLCATGVDEVEVTSFVSAKWVPQLGDAAEVFKGLRERGMLKVAPLFSALVPNEKGMEQAEEVAKSPSLLDKVSVFTAASETFSKKNTNATIAETMERFKPVIERAKNASTGPMRVRGYISCVIACPFEGPIAPGRVADVAASLVHLGVDEIDLGDTIGAGTPESIRAVLEAVRRTIGSAWWTPDKLTLHLHDTFGRAAECVEAALEAGVRSFDGSVAGLGGCPYASTPGKRAPGNIATETLVATIERAEYTTGVNRDRLAEAAAFAREIVTKSRAAAGGGA
ncbi:MAG: hydroxymethylglutaryl-CoA lyase [Phycisphaerales bacterium]|nr:hydroxymethylglutaryl-CoA lyase [Phycisphaerales bacterium]